MDLKWLNWSCSLEVQTRWRNISCTISWFIPSQTPLNRSVSTQQNSLYLSSRPKDAFLPSSSTRFFSKHALEIRVAESEHFQVGAEQSAQVEMKGFAAFTTQDRACGRMIIYCDYLVFMIEGSQNRN